MNWDVHRSTRLESRSWPVAGFSADVGDALGSRQFHQPERLGLIPWRKPNQRRNLV
jgi:hypothetical protein